MVVGATTMSGVLMQRVIETLVGGTDLKSAWHRRVCVD
jgi:hypothetical protein